jgi:hypothetical protein
MAGGAALTDSALAGAAGLPLATPGKRAAQEANKVADIANAINDTFIRFLQGGICFA